MTKRTSRSTVRRPARAALLGAAIAWTGAIALAPGAAAVTAVDDLSGGVTPTDLAQTLAGPGVTVSNVEYLGSDSSAGVFTETDPSLFGFGDGVVLSTGAVGGMVGPNQFPNLTTQLGTSGDEQLSALAGYPTFDATVLAFDFVPVADTVYISYVFASEEYDEYANKEFNDVFAFFVNGENCAVTDDGEPVSVNTINGGNPEDGSAPVRPDLYRGNTDGSLDMEPDGLTVVLVCDVGVRANEVNSMRLAIADGSDDQWDSWVLLAAQGITTEKPVVPLPAALTLAQPTITMGDEVTVTARIDNPNDVDEQIAQLSVDLPPGLEYTPGSASGIAEPTVSGSRLDFSDAGTIAAGDSLDFSFAVTATRPGTTTLEISGSTVTGAVIVAGAVDLTTGIITPLPLPVAAPPAWLPIVAGVGGAVIVLAAAAATTIALNTPRARQTRLLRRHVRLQPRQDTTGRQSSRPAPDAPKTKAPTFGLVPRQGQVEYRSIPLQVAAGAHAAAPPNPTTAPGTTAPTEGAAPHDTGSARDATDPHDTGSARGATGPQDPTSADAPAEPDAVTSPQDTGAGPAHAEHDSASEHGIASEDDDTAARHDIEEERP